MRRYCLALDLKDDPDSIREYENHHRNMRPEIRKSIEDAGVFRMDIYRFGNRLFMIMEVDDSFSFEKKAEMDVNNPKVQEWEELMWKYQQAVPGTRSGEKWASMKQIFEL